MKAIKTITIALLMLFITMNVALAADETNVFMYVNWADGSNDFIDVEQGRSVSVNYESYTPFPFDVETDVYLVENYDFANPVRQLIDRTDANGHYGFITLDTSSLTVGSEYTIYGVATELGDNTNNDAQVDFQLIANSGTNQAPTFNNIPTSFQYMLSDVDAELMVVNDYVSDPEGDILTINIDQSQTDSSILVCNLFFDSALHCDFIGAGTTTVDVTVSDGEFTITETIVVQVVNDGGQNTAPYFTTDLATVYQIAVSESTVNLVDLEDVSLDNENDDLTFTLDTSSTDGNVASCALVSGSSVTCAPFAVGATSVNVIVSDGELESSQTLIIEVYDDANGNSAPYFVGLDSFFTYPIGQGQADLANLATVAFDDNGDSLTFSVEQTDTSAATCGIENAATLHCDFNAIGTNTFDVIVSDGQLEARRTITIQITEDSQFNNAPFFNNLPLLYRHLVAENSATVVRLSDYAQDIDGDALTYSIDTASTDSSVLSCTLAATSDLNCDFNGVGSTTVDVTVTDGEFSDTATIIVQVSNANNAPSFVSLPSLLQFQLDQVQVNAINLAVYAQDIDGDILSFSVDQTNTDTSIVDCSIPGGSTVVCNLNSVGSTTIDVIVSDGLDSAVGTITIQVIDSNNNAPVFDTNMPTSFNYDISLVSIDPVIRVSDFVTDADGDALTFTIDQTNTDTSIVDCAMDASSVVSCDLNSVGITTVNVVADDGSVTASRTLTITVSDNSSNVPPVYGGPTFFQESFASGSATLVRAADFTSDADGDVLTYSISATSNPAVASCSIDAQTDIDCTFNGLGATTFDLSISDGQVITIVTLSLEVLGGNTGDANAVINGPTVVVLGNSALYNGSSSTGSNGAVITDYTWVIIENGLTITQSGANPVIAHTFTNEGMHTVTLTVTDASGNVDSANLTVGVFTEAPVAVINTVEKGTVNQITTFDGSSSFSPIGDTLVSYTWVIRDFSGVIVTSLTGAVVDYTFTEQGQYSAELIVTDATNRTGSSTASLEVRYGVVKDPVEYDPESGIKVESYDVSGYDFERARPGDYLEVSVAIKNVADEDLDNIRLTLIIPELGIKEKSRSIDLNEGERGTLSLYTELPEYVEAGVYYPQISISDGDIRRVKVAYLEVEE